MKLAVSSCNAFSVLLQTPRSSSSIIILICKVFSVRHHELLQEISAFPVYMQGTKKGILDADEEIKKSGASLIDYLEKEYHLQMSKPRFPCFVATNHFLDNTS
jgi:hypothetical protein